MRIFFASLSLLLLLLLSGCSGISEVVRTGAKANDDAVTASEFTICYGASVGAIRRSFNTPERIEAWKTMCLKEDGFTPD